LSYVQDDNGVIAIGATTRQCILERDPLIRRHVPLLGSVFPWIGHAATRARGTIGGSLAHADPAAELVLIAITLDATIEYRLDRTTHAMPARDFFTGLMTTALPAGACLTAVRFPRSDAARVGVGFSEISARRSDFAFASAAAQVELDEGGACRRLLVGVGAITEAPFRLDLACDLITPALDERLLRDTVRDALGDIEPMSDLHASADYRRRAAASLAVRAITEAVAAASPGKRHAN
jgi:carbon-monoxide dehydrogenase medium subunit